MASQHEPRFNTLNTLNAPHPHLDDEHCPLCDQALPKELTLVELESRLKQKERAAVEVRETAIRKKMERENEQAIAVLKSKHLEEIASREDAIRQATTQTVKASLRTAIEKAEKERSAALADKAAASREVVELRAQKKEAIEAAVRNALHEQREAMEQEKLKAVQKSQAEQFEANQRLQQQVEKLKRQLEQKTTEELGEGAEIDLYEALRDEYDQDNVSRVKKGQPGADIIHEVIHNGQVCGKIVYDSKNHGAWRNSFVAKLKQDQIAAHADHAVLTTSVFPSGSRQLYVQDGVIILNPARVIEMVRIVRQHIVQAHRLRLSADERDDKTKALYEFITSERCRQLMARYDSIAEDLLDIDVKEKAAHNKVWNRRGELLKSAQKVHRDFESEVDCIIESGAST